MAYEDDGAEDWEVVKVRLGLSRLIGEVREYIKGNRDGIDAWKPGTQVPMDFEGLPSAFITIRQQSDDFGRDTGRIVHLYVRSDGGAHERIATLLYGPRPGNLSFRRKRKHIRTRHYV